MWSTSRASVLFLQGAPPQIVVDALLSTTEGGRRVRCSNTSLLEQTVEHPVAKKFPMRASYSQAVARALMQALQQARSELSDDTSIEDYDAMLSDVEVWYAEHAAARGGGSREIHDDSHHREVPISFKSFAVFPSSVLEDARSHLEAIDGFVAIGVGPQFSNVGMSLWPSAFITALLLRDGLFGGSLEYLLGPYLQVSGTDDAKPGIVELGAGVGFTGALLQAWLNHPVCAAAVSKRRKGVGRCILTDYQEIGRAHV